MEAAADSTEIAVLGWSVILLIVHIAAQTVALAKDTGPAYALSSRDEAKEVSSLTGRLTRGLRNFLESYAAFVALALALAVTGKTGGLGATGALIWFWARVVYVPVFTAGLVGVRTGVWCVSMIGILLMLIRLMA
jgi:uncharacterized MAPEG superfamily protein